MYYGDFIRIGRVKAKNAALINVAEAEPKCVENNASSGPLMFFAL
jgi:hypothetical protein